jgi:hypothetical protein
MTNLDRIIEQIAFGKESRKSNASLGLYISPDTIYLAETHRDKAGKFIVDHLVRIPIPSGAKGASAAATMNTDFLSDPMKIAALVRQSMSQMRWNAKTVRVTLSHHLGLLRYFAMPAVERRFLRSAVPLEAKKYIPIPFDVLAHDFQSMPLPDAGGKARLGILIAVTQNKNLPNIANFLRALDIEFDGLEVAPCSVLRLWQAVDPPSDPAPFAHVHMDGGNVRVMISEHGVPVFFREVFLGADATLNDLRKIDLAGCLTFMQKQLGIKGLSHVRVSGNLPNLEDFRAAFASEANVDAVIQDTPRLLSVKTGDWGGYAALGASAHALVSTPMSLDLAAFNRVSEEERQAARNIMALGLLFSVLLGAAGIAKSLTYNYRARELANYPLAPDIKTAIGGMSPGAIEALLSDMQKQVDQLRSVGVTDRPKVSVILREIIVNMPDKLWLNSLSIEDPLGNGDHGGFHLTMNGHVQDQTVSDEQALAFKFKDDLLRSPVLSRLFDIQMSLQKASGTTGNEANLAGLDPVHLRERLEDRTAFTMDIQLKHR